MVYQTSTSNLKVVGNFHYISKLQTENIFITPRALGRLKEKMKFTQLRFNCFKKVPNRTVDIVTANNQTGENVVKYFTLMSNNKDDAPKACNSYYILKDDNSVLASHCQTWTRNNSRWSSPIHVKENRRLLDRVALIYAKNYWSIQKRSSNSPHKNDRDWECDDYERISTFRVTSGDFWKIFVR